uniref:Uncharacterized protein n=1 Tax=Anopheles christyi TaxID=43041 RepID=A0A182K6L7_9DIPT
MPTQKKKVKKPKEDSENKPPAANIKQEPEELKPLGAFVDDRLELIRQVFSCVKPKEIKYLLPDFLEGKSNDVIKERCLDELLGISTKRLHAIINNTKCPTDTESSEGGSDVEKIEEHISLDEISSSESDSVDSKRTGKRNKKADGSKQTDERNGEPKSEKEMTVLELLELQARARAIRSQLALEPVTKIEIDSEHEAEDGRHGDVDTDDESKLSTRARTTSKTFDAAKNGNQFKKENNSQQQTKRVRLKRNFRIRKVGDEDDEDEQELSSNPPDNGRERSTEQAMEVLEEEEEKAPERSPQNEAEEVEETAAESVTQAEVDKQDEPENVLKESETNSSEANVDTVAMLTITEESDTAKKDDTDADTELATFVRPCDETDRESSPEVIPVEASPETLCISSDSEEERLAKERASIFVPNIDELDRQAKKLPTPEEEKPAEDTEPEEGEISEEEEQPPEPTVPEAKQNEDQPAEAECSMQTEAVEGESVSAENPQEKETEQDTTQEKEGMLVTEAIPKDKSVVVSSGSSDEADSSSSSSDSSSSEAEDGAKTDAPPKLDHSAQDDEDIVEIHDSGDETLLLEDKPPEEEAKSWNTRWLKSNRVAKVMAASRLGNKVREKLKKKKQIQQAAEQQQQQQQQEKATDGPEVAEMASKAGDITTAAAEMSANVELGSVEHYRELVAQQESKQD